jgi:hypothetical protein
MCARSADNVMMVESLLRPEAFVQYASVPAIGLQDINIVKSLIDKSFNGDIDMDIKENIIVLSDAKRSVDVPLLDLEFIDNDSKVPDLQYENKLNLDASVFYEFVKRAEINKDLTIRIDTHDKKIMLSNTGKFKFTELVLCEDSKSGVSVKFGTHFIEVCNVFNSGMTEYSVRTDYPIKIVQSSGDAKYTVIIAPRVENV